MCTLDIQYFTSLAANEGEEVEEEEGELYEEDEEDGLDDTSAISLLLL